MSQASSEDEASEADEDEYLAAAVAATEKRDRKGRRGVKHPHLRALRSKLGSIRGKEKDPATVSPSSHQVRQVWLSVYT